MYGASRYVFRRTVAATALLVPTTAAAYNYNKHGDVRPSWCQQYNGQWAGTWYQRLLPRALAETAVPLERPKSIRERITNRLPELPDIPASQVRACGRGAEKILVTYGDGVFDITEFVEGHPGGDQILLAAGGPLEPFFETYALHQKFFVYEMLEEMRVGNLEQTSRAGSVRKRTETKRAADRTLSAPFHGGAARRCSGGIAADTQRSVLRAQPHAGARDRRRGLRAGDRGAGRRSARRTDARRSEDQVPEAYGGGGAAVRGEPTDGAERGADGEGRHMGRGRHRQRRVERRAADGRAQLRAAAEREGRVGGRCAARVHPGGRAAQGERRGAGVRDERRGAAARPRVPDPGGGAGRGGRAQREVGGQGGAGGGGERVALAAQGLPLRARRGRGGRGGRGGLRRGAEHPGDAGGVGHLLARGGRARAARGAGRLRVLGRRQGDRARGGERGRRAVVDARGAARARGRRGAARRVRLDAVARGGGAGRRRRRRRGGGGKGVRCG
ncbi:sulfite oxidase [Gracilaria domingensis]|nr:sulfite oxidase [Gracilaria domingensis]